jgi:Na+/proline symporter
LRWIVLLAAIVAAAQALIGWFGKRPWTETDGRLGMFLSISIDLQLLVGLMLYVFLSPATRAAFQNFGGAMSNEVLRFWAVEHVSLMIVALALIHAGRAMSRKAEETMKKHRRAAIFYGLATLIILFAIPWPFFPYGRPLLRLMALMGT